MVLLTTAGAAGILVGGAQAVHAATVTAQSGDTVSGLASKYHSSINAIEKANHINTTTHLIFAGQKYNIPTGDDAEAATTSTSTQAATQQASQAQATANQAQAKQAATTQTTQTSTTSNTASTQTASTATASASGSTYSQFIAAGGTAAMWNTIVMPESGGNPNAVSPNGYHGLGQTKESWGYGSVASQTQGMINYAINRYGSVGAAVAHRAANSSW